jgi:hypothetical protein
MNEKLKELYYQDDVIIGSKQNFINITKKSLNASTKEINDFLKNQEINQVNKNRINILIKKITALPRTYQIDIMYYPIGENFRNVLLIVDIQSRKAWAYVISSTSGETILKAYKKFESEVNIINAIEGDNQFSFKAFQDYNNEKNIRLDTSIAKEEHISSHGNKLGIIDRLIRTLKEMIEKYRSVVSKQKSFPEIIDKIISTYNKQPHRTIKSTPNERFNDVSKQNFNNQKDKEYNINKLKDNNISIGAEARILESKGKLEKGSQKYSIDLYKLVGREGNRFIVQDSEGEKLRRKLKPWPSLNPRCSREPHDRVPSGDTRCTYTRQSRERKMVPCEQPVLNKQNYAANARLDHKLLSAPSARSCKYRILLLLRSNVGHRSAAGSQRPSNQDLANSAIQTVAGGFPHVSGALLKVLCFLNLWKLSLKL